MILKQSRQYQQRVIKMETSSTISVKFAESTSQMQMERTQSKKVAG